MALPRRTILRTLAAFAAVVVASCASPTLPLPPPEEPDNMTPAQTDGLWIISGACSPGALVTVFNEETATGVVVEDSDADGRYTVELEAMECDVASIWQRDGDETSYSTSFIIVEKNTAVAADESICF